MKHYIIIPTLYSCGMKNKVVAKCKAESKEVVLSLIKIYKENRMLPEYLNFLDISYVIAEVDEDSYHNNFPLDEVLEIITKKAD